MHRYFVEALAILLLINGCTQYSFTGDPAIDAQQDGFFILKYVAWKECKIGGTLNQIAIRNSGSVNLHVEDLQLTMTNSGIVVTAKDTPRIYTSDVISTHATRVYEWWIPPGEWRYFAFPVKDCDLLNHKDVMEYNFRVELSAGDRQYINEATFEKIATVSPNAPL